MTNDQIRLFNQIENLHGYAHHVKSHEVVVKFYAQTLWAGRVEEFQSLHNIHFQRCYAWFDSESEAPEKIVIALKIGPIDSAQKAVEAAIALGAMKYETVQPNFSTTPSQLS